MVQNQNTHFTFHVSSQQMTIFFLGNDTFIQNPMMSVCFVVFCTLFHWILFYNNFIVCILQEIFSDLLNPVLITSIVFVALFAILSVLDCFLGEDGWYLVDLKQSQDAKHYFGERFVIVRKIQLSIWNEENHKSHIFQISCGRPARCTTSTSSVSTRRLNLQSTLSRGTSSPSKMIQGSPRVFTWIGHCTIAHC